MKQTKRLLSILLVAAMLLTMLPMTVFAESVDDVITDAIGEETDISLIDPVAESVEPVEPVVGASIETPFSDGYTVTVRYAQFGPLAWPSDLTRAITATGTDDRVITPVISGEGDDTVYTFEVNAGEVVTLKATPYYAPTPTSGTYAATTYTARGLSGDPDNPTNSGLNNSTRLTGAQVKEFTFSTWFDATQAEPTVRGELLSSKYIYTLPAADEDRYLLAEFGEVNRRNQEWKTHFPYTDASLTKAANALDLNNDTNHNVGYDPTKSVYGELYEKDLEAGGDSFYMDRVLSKTADTTSDSNTLWSRGRTLYLSRHAPGNVGFVGTQGNMNYTGYSKGNGMYIEALNVPLYHVTFANGAAAVSSSENSAARVSTPSSFFSQHTFGGSTAFANLTVDSTKFITVDNNAVLMLTLKNGGDTDLTPTVNVGSTLVTAAAGAGEAKGSRYVENSGERKKTILVDFFMKAFVENGDLFDVASDLSSTAYTTGQAPATKLYKTVTVPAGGSVTLRVVLGATTSTTPESVEEYKYYSDAAKDNDTVFKAHKANYNKYFADETPFVDTPDVGVNKAIAYRWWAERFNSQDGNVPGYTNQFPTSNEGSMLYNNAIVLTQPMHLQDNKWLRSGYLPYGQILNAGEISMNSAFLDIQSVYSWNNHYSQYTAASGLEAYKVIGGDTSIAEKFAQYFADDAQGQMDHYSTGGRDLMGYSSQYMPGNDSDAISFGYVSGFKDRPETAYVYGAAKAAAELYNYVGDTDKAGSVSVLAENIHKAISNAPSADPTTNEGKSGAGLWCGEHQMIEARRTVNTAVTNTHDDHDADNKFRIPAKESNMYDVFAQYSIPKTVSAWVQSDGKWVLEEQDTYHAFRYFADNRHFATFPYYTADQFDISRYALTPGSNNFSNINFTVAMRGYVSSLRYYDRDQTYITGQMLANSIDFMAWNIYPVSNNTVNLDQPNNSEYYSGFNTSTQTYSRNNNMHVNLGNYNWLFFEAMAGIIPRIDDMIELDPIDLGYEHFMVNNIKYHGIDMSVVWQDPDEYTESTKKYDAPLGFSLYLDGELVVTFDTLRSFVYNPDGGEDKFFERDTDEIPGTDYTPVTPITEGFTLGNTVAVPLAKDVVITDARLRESFKKVGLDITADGQNPAENLALGATVTASFTGRQRRPAFNTYHTPNSYQQGNLYPTASDGSRYANVSDRANGLNTNGQTMDLECAPKPEYVADGSTVNGFFWHNWESPNAEDWLELDLGTPKTFDNVRIWYYGDHIKDGMGLRAAQSHVVEYWDGGQWVAPFQIKNPLSPNDGMNICKTETITAQKLRVRMQKYSGHDLAVTEIQLYNTGDPADSENAVNTAPIVSASYTVDGPSVYLEGAATDDGLPLDCSMTVRWILMERPEGAKVSFDNPQAFKTTMTTDTNGKYVVRFEADDGADKSYVNLTINVTGALPSQKTAYNAALSARGTVPATIHTNGAGAPAMIDGVINAAAGAGTNTWGGNWGTNGVNRHWFQLKFADPVTIYAMEAMWLRDGTSATSGTREPASGKTPGNELQYGGTPLANSPTNKTYDPQADWTTLSLKNKNGSELAEIPTAINATGAATTWNFAGFDMITTETLRMLLNRVQTDTSGGIGVQEWQVYALEPLNKTETINIRYAPGRSDKSKLFPAEYETQMTMYNFQTNEIETLTHSIALKWDAAELASLDAPENMQEYVTVTGTNKTLGYKLEVLVAVRPADQDVGISGYGVIELVVEKGTTFTLPGTTVITYNDGAADTVKITWESYDPVQIASTAGIKKVKGTMTLPEHVVDDSNPDIEATINVVEFTNVTLTSSPAAGGYTDGGGKLPLGLSASFYATALPGYRFAGWFANESDTMPVSTNNPYTVSEVTAGLTLVAKFEVVSETRFATRIVPGPNGSVAKTIIREYEGLPITLSATPSLGYMVDRWEKDGEVVSREASFEVIPTGDATYYVYFALEPIPVTSIKINSAATTTVRKNKTLQLGVILAPANANLGTGITWSSSNEASVKIDAETGLVTGIKAGGSARVTATSSNGKTYTITITVDS